MHARAFPTWTMLPFVALVLCIAALPLIAPHAWEKRRFQARVVALCAAPVVAYLLAADGRDDLFRAAGSYASFICTLGALFVAAGGVFVTANVEATAAGAPGHHRGAGVHGELNGRICALPVG